MENIDNASKNQYLNILKENNVSLQKQFESNLFIPKIKEEYFYIETWIYNTITNRIRKDKRRETENDDILFVVNRVFKTEKEALDYYNFIRAEAELKLAIKNINEGWIADWKNGSQRKFNIYYSSSSNKLFRDSAYSVQRTSKESSFLFIKDSESAEYIIKNYIKQLLIYFGVEHE